MYFFGAQGADFCFFYRALHTSELNFGRFLHNRGSYDFFRTLAALAGRDRTLFPYALGYVTHYAADCVFHPYVYYLSGKSPVRHSRAEGALDFYFRKRDAGSEKLRAFGKYFNCPLDGEELSSLYFLYALAAARTDRAPLLSSSFLRSIGRFRSYTRFSARVFAKENGSVLNASHAEWHYPKDPARVLTDGADELFERALAESLSLIDNFRQCILREEPPDRPCSEKTFSAACDAPPDKKEKRHSAGKSGLRECLFLSEIIGIAQPKIPLIRSNSGTRYLSNTSNKPFASGDASSKRSAVGNTPK